MRGTRYRRTLVAGLCAALAAVLGLVLVWQAQAGTSPSGGGGSARSSAGGGTTTTAADGKASGKAGGKKPNILYVLTDDLSWNLVKYMPHVRQMMKQGTTFSNFFATDSLCCPSRSSILTGQFPHNTGVYDNKGDDGGYKAFLAHHDEKNCYGSRLQQAGYNTGFMGKYLNGYQPGKRLGGSKPHVPHGWNEWDVAGWGYGEYNYRLNENGHVVKKGHRPQDYLTDVISKRAEKFIDGSAKSKKPFMLETATFAPHGPSTPAPQDKKKFPGLKAPRNSAYDKETEHAPKWQKKLTPLKPKEKQKLDKDFAKRVRSVQAVDRMIGHLEKVLKANGQADDTYLMFGSDNGFHMGEHQLRQGKMTAYDTDIKVPMMVTGPGVKAGRKVPELAQNTDMNPTFQELAGLKVPSSVDGHSLAGLMQGRPAGDWRKSVLVEHHQEKHPNGDPDKQGAKSGDPPTYNALRTGKELYVEYADGEREFYTPGSDPNEMHNKIGSLSGHQRAALHKKLVALHHCKGDRDCTKASK